MSCRIDVVDLVEVMSSQSHECNPVLPAILYLVLHCVTHHESNVGEHEPFVAKETQYESITMK